MLHYTMMTEITQQLIAFFGPLGSPWWWILGAVAVTAFLAQWARSIRTLLPFIGAGTIIALIFWVLTSVGIVSWHWPY